VAPEKWLKDFKIRRGSDGHIIEPEMTFAQQIIAQSEIIHAVMVINNVADDAPIEEKETVVGDFIFRCMTYWLFQSDTLAEFDKRAGDEDGFVKIYNDHVEIGWQPRLDKRRLN
jgi:hypothetical protein